MLKDTCTQECKFWKKYKKGCPFFIETAWEDDKKRPYFLNDCTQKRSILMQQEMIIRLVALQKASEQERNAQHLNIKQLAYMAQAAVPTLNVIEATDVLDVDPQKLIEAPKE